MSHIESKPVLIFTADLGGTKLWMGIIAYDPQTQQYSWLDNETTIPTATMLPTKHTLFEKMCGFKTKACHEIGASIDLVVLGLPGPVEENYFGAGANLPPGLAGLSGLELARELGCDDGFLLNDCEATGWGVQSLGPADVVQLNPEVTCGPGNRCVAGAGTGLGLASIFYDRRRQEYTAFPSELCHGDFGPNGEEQRMFLDHLSKWYEHVSWDRVVSGPGINLIFRFLHHESEKRGGEAPSVFSEVFASDNQSATIAELALQGDPICRVAMQIFVECYAAIAANKALDVLAYGGVYLTGGIAPQIEPLIQQWFMEAFVKKGRLGLGGPNPILTRMPVFLVKSNRTALYGAAHYAMRQVGLRWHC